ncbi:hypothetical protein L7F22_033216 [Adiantum nelumboides]|nr:hypothetical protein [Adiantum nelumboides]
MHYQWRENLLSQRPLSNWKPPRALNKGTSSQQGNTPQLPATLPQASQPQESKGQVLGSQPQDLGNRLPPPGINVSSNHGVPNPQVPNAILEKGYGKHLVTQMASNDDSVPRFTLHLVARYLEEKTATNVSTVVEVGGPNQEPTLVVGERGPDFHDLVLHTYTVEGGVILQAFAKSGILMQVALQLGQHAALMDKDEILYGLPQLLGVDFPVVDALDPPRHLFGTGCTFRYESFPEAEPHQQVDSFLENYREAFFPKDILCQHLQEDVSLHAESSQSCLRVGNRLEGIQNREGALQLFFPFGENADQLGSCLLPLGIKSSGRISNDDGNGMLYSSSLPVRQPIVQGAH